ncbi:MAG: OmpA family protein [Thermodesulfobacteriota bacterium]
MNTPKLTSVSCCYGAAVLLSLFLLSGCACSPGSGSGSSAGCPKEVRYEGWVYTSEKPGVRSTVGKYDDVTDCYIVRKKKGVPPKSEVIRSVPQQDELVMVLEVSDVLFDFDKAVIKQPYVPELERWADYFKDNPQVTAKISGHTDSIGTNAYNQNLSERRAQAVINYLNNAGVASGRLSAAGFGESVPRTSNTTAEGRQKNRRVELEL